jgi:hypothetical protein
MSKQLVPSTKEPKTMMECDVTGNSAGNPLRTRLAGRAARWIHAQYDRAAGLALVAAGFSVLVVAWIGASGSPYLTDQVSYILSGGSAALVLLGIGATLLLVADLRDQWTKLDQVEDELNHLKVLNVDPPPADALSEVSATGLHHESNGTGSYRIAADRAVWQTSVSDGSFGRRR